MPLTNKQRKAILERDSINGEPICMFPHRDSQKCEGGFHVHHIKPQRWWIDRGIKDEELHHHTNLLTICQWSHERIIHPDVRRARLLYSVDPRSFERIMVERDNLSHENIPYWNTTYDHEMSIIAKHRSMVALLSGWEYPTIRKKKAA